MLRLVLFLSFIVIYYCNYYVYGYDNTYMLQVKQSIIRVKPSGSNSRKTINSTSPFYSSKINPQSGKTCNTLLMYPEYTHSALCYPHL